MQWPSCWVTFAQEVDPAGQVLVGERGLQRFFDAVGKIAAQRQQLLEQRDAGLHGGEKLVVGEPDEILERRGNELVFVGIGDLQFEFHAGAGKGERINDFAEHAGIAETLRGLFEVSVGGGLADFEAARS